MRRWPNIFTYVFVLMWDLDQFKRKCSFDLWCIFNCQTFFLSDSKLPIIFPSTCTIFICGETFWVTVLIYGFFSWAESVVIIIIIIITIIIIILISCSVFQFFLQLHKLAILNIPWRRTDTENWRWNQF